MAAIYAGSSQYCAAGATKTLHSKAGKIHKIIYGGAASGTITFYDNTAGSGTVLLVLNVTVTLDYQTREINFDSRMPMVFTTGLTVVTPANVQCFVITEA
jgi:hypothetical protein